jgi:acetyl esterase/lipase
MHKPPSFASPRHPGRTTPSHAPGALRNPVPGALRRRTLLAGLPLGLLAGCGGGADGGLSRDLGLQADIAYGPSARQRLTVYHPAGPVPPPGWPVLVAFHGGFWQYGSRDEWQMHLMARRIGAQGIVVVLADYRLYPEVTFPAFVEDGAAAVAWAARNAHALGGDPGLLFAAGHSAGAHIAVLLGLDRRYLDAHGLRLAGAVGIAGPYGSWFQSHPLVRGAFPPALRGASSPIALAHAGGAPLLLLGARLDVFIRPADATELAARIQAAGGRAEARTYPASHASIMLSLLPGAMPAHADTAAFISRIAAEQRMG